MFRAGNSSEAIYLCAAIALLGAGCNFPSPKTEHFITSQGLLALARPGNPTFSLIDSVTQSADFSNSGLADLKIAADSEAKKWCVSEIQSRNPQDSGGACVGGIGPDSQQGWSLTRPTSLALSPGDSAKQIYLWVAGSNGQTNLGVTTAIIFQDRTAPVATINSSPSALTNQVMGSFTFSGSDTGSGIKSWQCQLDGGALSPCTSPAQYTGLLEGPHSFVVQAIDQAGNFSAPLSMNWQVKLTAPTALISSGPLPFVNTTAANLQFSGSGGAVSFQCALDGGPAAPCTSPKSYTGLTEGSHSFRLTATDGAGNISSAANYTWVIDLTPPTLSVVSSPSNPSDQSLANFVLSATDSGGSGIAQTTCALDAGAPAPCAAMVSYPGLSAGAHTFKAQTKDQSGNLSNSVSFSWTVVLPLSISGNWNFQILIDVNQLSSSDFGGAPQNLAPLSSDGVWAITVNSSDLTDPIWSQVLAVLNASKWIVSEDNPQSAYDFNRLNSILGRTVDGSFNYFEDKNGFWNTLNETGYYLSLNPSQFYPAIIPSRNQISDVILGNTDAANGHFWEPHPGATGRVIVHTRSYGLTDPRRQVVDLALQDPRVSGAALELTAAGGGLQSYDWWTALDVNGFVKACLSSGKRAYLLVPGNDPSSTGDYLTDIQSAIPYLLENGLLSNPDVYVVLANYGRNTYPYVGVLSGDNNTGSRNSLLAASQWLKRLRAMPAKPPSLTGVVDGVFSNGDGTSHVGGWACILGSTESMPVYLFVGGPAGNGGKLLKTAVANLTSEPAVASACGSTGSNYRMKIQLSALEIANSAGKTIYVYAISPFGAGNTLLPQSGLFTVR